MKKKIVCLSLVLVLGALLAACGTAADLSQAGLKDLTELKSLQENLRAISSAQIHAKTESTMKFSAAEKTTVVKTEIKAELAANQNKDTDMKISQKEIVDGTERQSLIYIKGKQAYIDTGTEKIHVAADQISVNPGMLGQYLIEGLDEETVKGLEKKEEKDGYVYQLTVDGSQFMEYLKKISAPSVSEVSDAAAADIEKMDFQIAADKENMVKTVQMDCAYRMAPDSKGENTLEASYQAQIEYRRINTGSTIDFPDFSSYKAMNTEK